MDTKLKKSHKLATIIITLCILIPAFLLVSLYPRIGKVMGEKRAEYEERMQILQEQNEKELYEEEHTLSDRFVNYAMEAGYYLYATIMAEQSVSLNMDLLENYGWINDYWKLYNNVQFKAVYDDGTVTVEKGNTDVLASEEALGYFTITFDSGGYLEDIILSGDFRIQLEEADTIYKQARKSVEQFENNVTDYEINHEVEINEKEYMPKDFSMTMAIYEDCDFITESHFGYYDWYDYETQLFDTGAVFVIILAAVFVAIMALILPFFKKLETGWEKLFCAPFEIIVGITGAGIGGAVGMYYAMAYTCGSGLEIYSQTEILGVAVTAQMLYSGILILNFIGWAMVFLAEYMVVTSFRQFLCGPVYYIKQRLLIVIIFRWLKKYCVKLYRYVANIKIGHKLNSTIIKIVLVNFVVLTLLCTMWFFGIIGLIIYSVILYIVLRKYGEGLQKQYNSVLKATEQMAEGNLKISLEEELGPFQPIGNSLEKVQQGFEKAVVEEAKSQNMKTELITNVSHDLKTPLTAIITYVNLLKKEDITEDERKSYIETLDKKSQRLKVLIEDLFEVSKAHSGNVTMNFMDVDVVSLMKQVKSEMSDQIETSNLTFRFNLPEEKVMLLLDGQRTYRIFENLLSNALKYAMPYSRVYVDMQVSDSDVKIIFRNTSAEELDFAPERLTERFVRGDASRNSEGSGLGLAIAKSFMELQHGKLNIEVDGDLFKVTLTWNK